MCHSCERLCSLCEMILQNMEIREMRKVSECLSRGSALSKLIELTDNSLAAAVLLPHKDAGFLWRVWSMCSSESPQQLLSDQSFTRQEEEIMKLI